MILKLTTAKIDLPEGKDDVIYFDTTLKGFGLRVRRRPSDGRLVRAWVCQYRAHGHARRYNIGDAEKVSPGQAREAARKLLSKVELGGDPQAERFERREKDVLSLRSVIADYLAAKTNVRPNTMRMLKTYLNGSAYLGSLQRIPVDRITRKDIAARLLAVSKKGTRTAIAFRGVLVTLFAWAVQTGLVDSNPVIGAVKPSPPPPRDRVLDDAELAAIWRALDDTDYGTVVKLLILTGSRREEVAGMRWGEFDLDRGTWTLPATRAKNKRPHTLPLSPLMEKVVGSVARDGTDHPLFGRKHFTSWSFGKRALDKKLGLKKWTHHDIRRSVATGMGNIGIQPHIIEEVLNHKSGHKRGVAGIYNRSLYERDVRDAVLRWSDHVRSLVDGGRKVLPYKPKRAVRALDSV
jgi:integrase